MCLFSCPPPLCRSQVCIWSKYQNFQIGSLSGTRFPDIESGGVCGAGIQCRTMASGWQASIDKIRYRSTAIGKDKMLGH